jgi:hypothetical protein
MPAAPLPADHRRREPSTLRSPLRAVGAALAFSAAASTFACGGAGAYGYAPTYTPLDDEAKAASSAREYDPVMAERSRDEWQRASVVLFGIVTRRVPGPSGGADLTLSLRRLEPRNLCEDSTDASTCRVTVSDKEFGVLHAIVPLRAEDDVGPRAVAPGSLLRIVGALASDVDATDGAPIVRASYYRHWPRYFYVTRAAAEHMRQ